MDIYQEIEAIKAQLARVLELLETEKGDKLLSIEQAAEYLGCSRSAIYKRTMLRAIPFCKPEGGKRIYFYQSQLDEYIRKWEVVTSDEIDRQANQYMLRRAR